MAKNPQSIPGVEYEQHIVATRLRVTGSGNLLLSLQDISSIQNQSLLPIPMQATTRIESTVLANFQSQRTRLIGQTVNINEIFQIRRIIIYAKPVATEYPL